LRPTILLLLASVVLAAGGCGPHMQNQASIRSFKQQMPRSPAGQVAFAVAQAPEGGPAIGGPAILATQSVPVVPNSPHAVAVGRVFYGYYCLMCHGDNGHGRGPVGESYVPVPTDLTLPRIHNANPAQLARMMVSGVGHAPVLEDTVPPVRRLYIAWFVKSLKAVPTPRPIGAGPKAPGVPPTGLEPTTGPVQ